MKLNKYIASGAVALIVAGFSSCDSKNDPAYIPAGSVDDAQRVFFAKNAVTQIVTAEETSFNVTLYRPDLNIVDENGQITSEMPSQTVTLSTTAAEEGVLGTMITVPTEITFEAGSPNAAININYDPSKMKGNHNYALVLTVDPKYANEYSISQMTLKVNKEEYTDWEPFAVGGLTEERNGEGSYTFGVYYSGTEDPVRVLSRTVPTNPDDIQFQFQWLIDNDDPSKGFATFMTAYTKDGGKIVHINRTRIAYNSTFDADVYAEDTYSYTGNDKYKGLSKFDPETGLFTLDMYYYMDGIGGWGPGTEYLQLRGYKDTNVYEVNLNALGQTQIEGKDYALVSFNWSEAVDYVEYTVVDGELSSDEENNEVAAVVEKMTDPDQTEYTIQTLDKAQTVAMTFPSSGDYTVVAVGYNIAVDGSAEAKCSASASFEYTTFDPYAGWSPVTTQALYQDDLISTLVGGQLPPENLIVNVDKCDDHPGLYRITNPYANSEYVDLVNGLNLAPFGSIEFAIMGDGRVYFPISDTGLLDGADPISIASYSYFAMAQGVNPDEIPDNFFATLTDGTNIFMDATGGNTPSFVCWYGDDGAYKLDMAFYLDLTGKAPEGKPASKKAASTFAKIIRDANPAFKAPAFPAFYKAQKHADLKVDRNLSRKLGR